VGRSGLAPGGSSQGTDSVAVASVVAGMLPAIVGGALFLFQVHDPFGRVPGAIWVIPLPSIAAVILGHAARRRARLASRRATLATLGVVLGYLGLAVYLAIAIVLLAVAGIVGEP